MQGTELPERAARPNMRSVVTNICTYILLYIINYLYLYHFWYCSTGKPVLPPHLYIHYCGVYIK